MGGRYFVVRFRFPAPDLRSLAVAPRSAKVHNSAAVLGSNVSATARHHSAQPPGAFVLLLACRESSFWD